MKALIWSNAPFTSTGYGIQTRHLCNIFEGLGHEVAVAANYGLMGAAIYWKDIPIYPVRQHPFGFDVLPHYANHFDADFVLTLYDPWAFPPDLRQRVNRPWVSYTPIDARPVPKGLALTLRNADYLVSMSEFGHDQLWDAGLPSDYIPLCVDTDVFKPGDREAAREELGIDPDIFLAVVVAVNKDRIPSRKSWPEILTAWKGFLDHTRNKGLLYCHTTKAPFATSPGDGFYFDPYTKALEIPGETLAFPDAEGYTVGAGDDHMALTYQAADVVLLPSMAEGFGMPLVEAQATGTPVISIAAHTGPELTKLGVVTQTAGDVWIPTRRQFWAQANPESITDALLEAFSLTAVPDLSTKSRQRAVDWVQDNYSIEAVTPKWDALLAKVEAGLW